MLTKKDITLLTETLKAVFVTREEFNAFRNEMYEFREEMDEFKKEMKNDLLQFKDDILWEIKAMREELAITTGYRAIIEDHEIRLVKLETKKNAVN